MFELFTVRARKVVELAKQEAKRVGDDYVGTQHILFGLAREGSGVGHHILEINNVSYIMIRQESEKIIQKGSEATANPQFTPRSKKVFEYTIDEAKKLNHNYVGTEHLLLGLLRESECVAVQILTNFGLNIEQLRTDVLNLLGFFDKDYQFKTIGDKKEAIIIMTAGVEDVIGTYDANNDEILFIRPLPVNEIQRIISVLRRVQYEKK